MNKLIFAENMFEWFVDKNYLGHDPYQLDEKASIILKKYPALKKIRKILKPFHSLIPKTAFKKIKPILHPKALGLIISGNTNLFIKTGNIKFLNENNKILKLLIKIKNKEFSHLCWGHPFEWGDTPRYKINDPLICVTAPIGLWLLDWFEVSKEKELLEIIVDIKNHIIKENKWITIKNNQEAIYYSNYNDIITFNGASMVALFLARLGEFDKNSSEEKRIKNLTNFIIKGQNENGSWNYSYNVKQSIIDNRHTGFILENLKAMSKFVMKEEIDKCISFGEKFYLNNLCDFFLPKWSINSTYPIDAHDVGQAIITFNELGRKDLAEKLIEFTIKNLSNGKNQFYFKLFKSGKKNKNVFIRWNQAWMYNAICKSFKFKDDKIRDKGLV